MNSLRQIGTFVGIPRGSLEAARFGGPRVIGQRMVSALVLNGSTTGSMRAIFQALQHLSPITLEAEVISDRSGEEPLPLVVRVNASGGIAWFTTVTIKTAEQIIAMVDLSRAAGGDFRVTQLGPGRHQLTVSRIGISDSGFVTLSKSLGTMDVSAAPKPPKQPDPQTPLQIPSISVQSNGDGSFKVSGSGFVPPNATVNILVGDGTVRNPLNFTITAINGAFRDFPTGKICQRPGSVFFQASDGRIEHGSQLFSNTVQISCPF